MNIAFVSSDTPSALQGKDDLASQRAYLMAVARELGREHKVTIYTRRHSDADKPKVRLSPGVTLEYLPAGPARDLPEDGLLPYLSDLGEQLMRRWGQDRPDVIHAHSWTGGLAAIAGASGLDVPFTQTFGGQDGQDARKVKLRRAIGRRASVVIAGCGDEESSLIRMGVPRRN
ncbi:glycosyltransferase, partial [Streptosporangium algeriense]